MSLKTKQKKHLKVNLYQIYKKNKLNVTIQ